MEPFEKVVGYDSLKQQLAVILDVMRNPQFYEKFGTTCSHGLLLYGEPGLGKTTIAQCFVEASGRNVVICRKNASEERFIDSICRAFDAAAASAPSVILLDDMDKFANDDRDHKDSEAFVTIQSCIDDVKDKEVFVVATANDIDKLPDSLIRTGRFDNRIHVRKPSSEDSERILLHYLSEMDFDDDFDTSYFARLLRGNSCSTLETIANQASLFAGFRRSAKVSLKDMIYSYLLIAHHVPQDILEPDPNIDPYGFDEKVYPLWHEAGHLVVGEILAPGSVLFAFASTKGDDLKGMVSEHLGLRSASYTDKNSTRIQVGFGGMAAIDIHFGSLDPGAGNDLYNVVSFIDDINSDLGGYAGLSRFGGHRTSDSGRNLTQVSNTAIAELYYQQTKELLCKNRAFLEDIACALAEKVVLTACDIQDIKKRHKIIGPGIVSAA